MARTLRPLVMPQVGPAPFNPAYLDTVFLVPERPAAWPDVFAIVTAHNPLDRQLGREQNESKARELDAYLVSRHIESFGVTGASPDLSHREAGHGFAVRTLEEADAVSRRFGQAAFFLVEDGEVYVCVDASGRGWRIGAWTERLVSTGP